MKSSGISSSTPIPTDIGSPRPNQFALKGHSVALDPLRYAVRPDLADIRLAEYVFAPHYAAPLLMTATCEVPLRAAPADDAEVLGMLAKGDVFEALDITSGRVWGTVPGLGLVGYADRAALAIAGTAGQ